MILYNFKHLIKTKPKSGQREGHFKTSIIATEKAVFCNYRSFEVATVAVCTAALSCWNRKSDFTTFPTCSSNPICSKSTYISAFSLEGTHIQGTDFADFSERRTSSVNSQQFGDSHQLFLGNVPHHATEEELKALFSKFGIVVDLRIHSKSVSKMPGLRHPPYYGFITYEDPESVQNCLANCPLYFPDNSPDGQKLNVEEKKTRLRTSNDISRLQNNMSNSGSMGSAQRQTGGGPSRSLSNSSGGLMRGGNSGGNGPLRGSTGGSGPTGGFNRNDNRGPGGPPSRGNGNATTNTGSGS